MASETSRSKPSMYSVAPFDVAVGTVINFQWVGRQIQSSTLTIKRGSTQVYQDTTVSFKSVYIIPQNASGLTNGNTYTATLKVTDMDGAVSAASEPITFMCFTTPDFHMDYVYEGETERIYNTYSETGTIVNDVTIEASSMRIRCVYSQAENEPLSSWRVNLYSSAQVLLDSSPELYYASDTEWEFSGLVDSTQYYLEILGGTVHGMLLDSGRLRISIQYSIPSQFANLTGSNNPDEGNILLESNVISLSGDSSGNIKYLKDSHNNEYAVDLTNGSKVWFDEGFFYSSDFTLTMAGPSTIPMQTTFLTMQDTVGNKYEVQLWRTPVAEFYRNVLTSETEVIDEYRYTDQYQFRLLGHLKNAMPLDIVSDPVCVSDPYFVIRWNQNAQTGKWVMTRTNFPKPITFSSYYLMITKNNDMFGIKGNITGILIRVQPEDLTIPEHGSGTFSVTATGSNLTYQWQYSPDNEETWIDSDFDSATTRTLTVPGYTNYQGFRYRCVVSGSQGIAYSASALLTVTT